MQDAGRTLGRGAVLGLVTMLTLALAGAARGQCDVGWIGNGPLAGVDGPVLAMCRWDPDGAGPLPVGVAVGGTFQVAGGALAGNVAFYDPVADTWSALGAGTNGTVHALVALPTGELVVGGEFAVAGGVTAHRLARWDGAQWHTMGWSLQSSESVRALVVDGAGDLVVGGQFTAAGGSGSGPTSLARWNGQSWQFTAFNGRVEDLAVTPSGGLVAVGQFSVVDGVTAHGATAWDGASWTPLGSGLFASGAYTLRRVVVQANGDVVVAGKFVQVGGVTAANVARWDGLAWHPIGTGLPFVLFANGVEALEVAPNGDVYAGGSWLGQQGATPSSLHRWDGVAWSPVGGSPMHEFHAIVQSLGWLSGGDLLVGGSMLASKLPSLGVARWTGTSWRAAGAGTAGFVWDAASAPDGSTLVAGAFGSMGGTPARHVARWNGAQWAPLGPGEPLAVGRMVALRSGNVVTMRSGLYEGPLDVAEWNGTTWTPHWVGWNAHPRQLAQLANGDLVFSGPFTTAAGGVAAARIVRYDGSTWSPFGGGLPREPAVLFESRDGSLVVTTALPFPGAADVLRWDGAVWSQLGGPFDRAPATAIELPNGDLVVGGRFTSVGGVPMESVARWDGAQWHAMGGGLSGSLDTPGVVGFCLRRDGALFAFGGFVFAGTQICRGIARWDGVAWLPLGAGLNATARAAFELPGGDLLVTGDFTQAGGVPARGLARWDGVAWSEVAGGLDRSATRFVVEPDGDVAIVGQFRVAGGQVSPGVAWLRASCPALAATAGAGCSGTAGPVTLAATRLPWLGDTFEARTTNVPSPAFAVLVWGFAGTSVPLAALLPFAVPGCDLLATPDVLELALPTAGDVASTLPIPATAALVGHSLWHQVAPVELTPAGAVAAVTTSNALRLTIGTF